MKFQKLNLTNQTNFGKLLFPKINNYKLNEDIHKINGFLQNTSTILNSNSFS